MSNYPSLKGKKYLVTGAGRGIGYELVKSLLLDHGAIVYGLTKSKDKLEQLTTEFSSTKRFLPLLCDLNDWDDIVKVLEPIEPLDGIINNAGVAIEQDFGNVTKDSFDTLFNVNVRAIVCISQIITKKMIANKISGTIVNISSVSSTMPTSGLLIYGTTKGAVDRLTKGMTFELGKHQIRVNCINPTIVLTDMGIQLWKDEKKANTIRTRIPMGKFAMPKEVVDGVLFLLDNEKSGMITGSCIPVDGGQVTYGVKTTV